MSRRLIALALALVVIVAACGDSDLTAGVDAGDNVPTSAAPGGGDTDGSAAPPDDAMNDDTDPMDGNMGPDDSLPINDGDAAGGTQLAGEQGAFAVADLQVFISHPDHDTVIYRLSCLGDTATIDNSDANVDTERACRALLDPTVVTRLVDGPDTDLACTEIFGGPDIAEMSGTINGATVAAMVHRANGCGIDDWDRVLVDVVPPAYPMG